MSEKSIVDLYADFISEQNREQSVGMNTLNEVRRPLHSELHVGTSKSQFDPGHRIHITYISPEAQGPGNRTAYHSDLSLPTKEKAIDVGKKVKQGIVDGLHGEALRDIIKTAK